MGKITLGTRKVSIEFPGVKALSDVDFEIGTGVIHAVMGANGAGKSTLMKVLAGSNPDYTGEVLYNGKAVELRNPAAAKAWHPDRVSGSRYGFNPYIDCR